MDLLLYYIYPTFWFRRVYLSCANTQCCSQWPAVSTDCVPLRCCIFRARVHWSMDLLSPRTSPFLLFVTFYPKEKKTFCCLWLRCPSHQSETRIPWLLMLFVACSYSASRRHHQHTFTILAVCGFWRSIEGVGRLALSLILYDISAR